MPVHLTLASSQRRRKGFLLALVVSCSPLLGAAPETQPVEVVRSSEQAIVEQVRVTGTVTSPRAANLSPSIPGLISEFLVDAGAQVKTGDVLVKLDSELEALALQQARAAESEARAALDDAERRLREAERLIDDIAETELESRRAEVNRLEANLDAAAARVAQQAAVVRRHEVRAPFEGVVGRRLSEVGEWIGTGSSLLELVAMHGLRFDFRVPQSLYPRIDTETDVTLHLDAVPDLELAGSIEAIVPVNDPGARTFLLRITSVDVTDQVIPGMSTWANLHIETGRKGVVVPRDAILRYPDGRTTLWIVDNSGEPARARERVVQIGLQFDGMVEVRSGLESGRQVVTRGNESLQPDQAIRIL